MQFNCKATKLPLILLFVKSIGMRQWENLTTLVSLIVLFVETEFVAIPIPSFEQVLTDCNQWVFALSVYTL